MNSLFDITLWAFPSSLIIAVGYIAVLFLINHYCKNSKLYKDFSSIKSALFLTLILLLLIIIEGIWAIDIYHRWYFLVSALFFMSNLGFAIIKRVNKKAGIGFLMNHIGLFLIVWGMFFGAPDYEKGGILLENGFEERFAQKESGEMMPLPFKIELDSFRIDYYEASLTPKQFKIGRAHV